MTPDQRALATRLMTAAGAALDARYAHGFGSPQHLAARKVADAAREALRTACDEDKEDVK